MIISQVDARMIFTGQSLDVGAEGGADQTPDANGCRWVALAPPEDVPEGGAAIYAGGRWSILSAEDKADMDLAAAKVAKQARITARVEVEFERGYAPGGVFGAERLQVRSNLDRTNWLTSQASYSAAVAQGHGAVVNALFRTAENTSHKISYQDGLNVLLGMAAWGAAIYGNSWKLKDDCEEATTMEELDAIDEESGWPA